jgi:hypothetical protein
MLLAHNACCLSSCQSGDTEDRLVTANGEIIKLEQGEKSTKVNKMDKFTFEAYQRYFNSITTYQCPLNKAFHSSKIRFYYGLPINVKIPVLYNSYLERWGSSKVVSCIQPDSSHAEILVKDSLNFILFELLLTSKNNFLLGGAVSTDSETIMSLYKEGNLKARILNDN